MFDVMDLMVMDNMALHKTKELMPSVQNFQLFNLMKSKKRFDISFTKRHFLHFHSI